jgi:hypothetical protein
VTISRCLLRNAGDSSIIVEQGAAEISDCEVIGSQGNSLNVQLGGAVVVNNSRFVNANWPLCAFCEKAHGVLTNCIFDRSGMSGIVLRGDSSLVMRNCIVNNCQENGIRICDCRDIVIQDTVVADCLFTGIELCDAARAVCERVVVSAARLHGVNVYARSSVCARDLVILGPTERPVSVHHGGFGELANVLISLGTRIVEVPKIPAVVGHLKIQSALRSVMSQTPVESIIEVDTPYRVIVTHGYLVGQGRFELFTNVERVLSAEDPKCPGQCVVCRRPASEWHLAPCGHSTFCFACWNALETKPAKCPLCRLAPDALVHEVGCGESKLCPICYENEANMMILNCGHTICRECSIRWFSESGQCPFCREPLATMRLLVSYG